MTKHIITDLPTFRIVADVTDHAIDIYGYVLIDNVWKGTGGIILNNKEFETINELRK